MLALRCLALVVAFDALRLMLSTAAAALLVSPNFSQVLPGF
jgi:hypothetical protein